ncbi:MAG: hypothetical protein ACFFFC_16435 [Candidatus Thorarchaeota archaeon]
MKKPDTAYGVYHLEELSWKFFAKKKDAMEFKAENENRFGPYLFSFEEAIQQASNDLLALPGTIFITEDEFVGILNGEDVSLSFFESDTDDDDDEVYEEEEDDRLEPSMGYFEHVNEAILWLRASGLYIWNHMADHAAELGFTIDDYDYYDGFLSRIGSILDDYFEDIENFEQLIDNLYDGVDDMVFDEEELDD